MMKSNWVIDGASIDVQDRLAGSGAIVLRYFTSPLSCFCLARLDMVTVNLVSGLGIEQSHMLTEDVA